MRFGELSSLLILGSGGRRLRTRTCLSVERVRLRRALPAPAKEPQVPWNLHSAAAPSDDGHCEPKRRRKPRPPRRSAVTSHQPRPRNAPQRASRRPPAAQTASPYARQQLRAASGRLPPLRTTGTANPSAGASRDHRGAAPSSRTNLAPETHPSSRAATSAAWTASPMRGSSCARPQAACRPFGRRALRTRAQAQAATTAAQRRRLAPTLHQKRTPAVEPPPRRRGLRRPNAAATARSLRLYLTNWGLVGKIEVGGFSIFLSGGMFL